MRYEQSYEHELMRRVKDIQENIKRITDKRMNLADVDLLEKQTKEESEISLQLGIVTGSLISLTKLIHSQNELISGLTVEIIDLRKVIDDK